MHLCSSFHPEISKHFTNIGWVKLHRALIEANNELLFCLQIEKCLHRKIKEFCPEAKAENMAKLWQSLGPVITEIILHLRDFTSLKTWLEEHELLQ